MADGTWAVEGDQAILRAGPLRGAVRWAAPRAGIGNVLWNGAAQSYGLLGVGIADAEAAAASVADTLVRGSDLIITYGETADRPYRCQIDWRAHSAEEGQLDAPVASVLDLVVSVETSRLETQLDVNVAFALPATSSMVPGTACGPSCGGGPDAGGQAIAAKEHCLLAIPPDPAAPLAVMMVHPDDFRETWIEPSDDPARPARVTFPIFGRRVEKGVLLRARVRCILSANTEDRTAAVRAWHDRLLEADLPLRT